MSFSSHRSPVKHGCSPLPHPAFAFLPTARAVQSLMQPFPIFKEAFQGLETRVFSSAYFRLKHHDALRAVQVYQALVSPPTLPTPTPTHGPRTSFSRLQLLSARANALLDADRPDFELGCSPLQRREALTVELADHMGTLDCFDDLQFFYAVHLARRLLKGRFQSVDIERSFLVWHPSCHHSYKLTPALTFPPLSLVPSSAPRAPPHASFSHTLVAARPSLEY